MDKIELLEEAYQPFSKEKGAKKLMAAYLLGKLGAEEMQETFGNHLASSIDLFVREERGQTKRGKKKKVEEDEE